MSSLITYNPSGTVNQANIAALQGISGAVGSNGQIGYATPVSGVYNTPATSTSPTSSFTSSPTHAVTTTVKTTPVVSPQSSTQSSAPSGLITSVDQATKAGAFDAQYGMGSYNQTGGVLPVTGSPDHTAISSYAGTTVPSTSNNFSVEPTGSNGTVPSSSLGTGSTYNDALNQRNTYEKNLLAAYNDPQIQQARQAAADANTNLMSAQKAQRDQNLAILSDGGMTRQQATPFATQADLINSNNVANYGLAANAAANQLGVYTQNQQNQIQGYGSLLSANQQDIQNQLAQVPGYLGTVTSPTGDLYVQTRDPITGQVKTTSAANIYGSAGGSGNIMQSAAQSLVDGTQSPSQIAASGLNTQLIYQMANQISQQTKGVPFNAQQAEANFGASKDALVQNATTYRTLANAQSTAMTHLNDLETYFNQVSKTSFPAANSILNWIQRGLGSGALQAYETTLQNARGEVAKVLAGGGAPSDADLKAANATLPNDMSPAQFQGAIQATKMLMQQKIAEYSNTGNVAQYGSQSSGGSNLYSF